MEKVMVFFVSDCCNVESDKDHAVCSRCGEHCEIITEEYERDYIPGYDDGEIITEEYERDYIPGYDDGEW